jgi:hypothetical protein
MLFHRHGHGGGGFARTDDDQAPRRLCRQVRKYPGLSLDGGNGNGKKVFEKGPRIDLRIGPWDQRWTHASACF